MHDVPPLPVKVWLYGEPTTPELSVGVVIAIASFTFNVNVLIACWFGLCESVTVMVTEYVPATVGVPTSPVDGLTVTPAGRPVALHT